METFIGTLIFLLPGFLMYFWIQAFGVNPVSKHSVVEMTAIAGLLWLPVSAISLGLYNLGIVIAQLFYDQKKVWTLNSLTDHAGNITFLLIFLALSILVSFLLSFIYVRWIEKELRKVINKVRKTRGFATYSTNASVWDEVFMKNEPQIVEVGSIVNPEGTKLIGQVDKVSRTFEPERLNLNHVEYVTKIINKYNVPVSNIYYDIKAGTYIKVYNIDEFDTAQKREIATSSS